MPVADANEQWLSRLRALAEEIEIATQALVAGRIDQVEASTSRQRQLCAQIRHQAAAAAIGTREDESGSLFPARIREAVVAVDTSSRRYAALLRHCGRSLKMWMAVAHEREGRRQFAVPVQRTWSCEG